MKWEKEKIIEILLWSLLFMILNTCGLVIIITSFMSGESAKVYNKLLNNLIENN